MEAKTIKIDGFEFECIKINFENAPLLIIKANTGFLACGYIDIVACNKLGDVVAIVKGVISFDDMLRSNVAELSERAKSLLKMPMTGKDFLMKISKK